jgi:hypothetical protein
VENASTITGLISNNLRIIPHIPQLPQNKNNDPEGSQKLANKSTNLILEWLQIVVIEGHIEPSQPSVGKIVGWPGRAVLFKTLFTDFTLWCKRQGISDWQIPRKELFGSLLDEVFCRNSQGNKYDFPPRSSCLEKLSKLREAHGGT